MEGINPTNPPIAQGISGLMFKTYLKKRPSANVEVDKYKSTAVTLSFTFLTIVFKYVSDH